ncbi:MAG: hypothetical protein JNK41_06780 [Saprospiraceae bacterium]|nr:hypothetical protein [Saprospiraceae bacterium]
MTDNLLKLVNEFANRNNFPDDEWYARGLVPSSSEKIAALNESIKDVAQGILESFSKTGNQRFLQQKLENLHLQEFDTEEKDFLFDKLRLLWNCNKKLDKKLSSVF